MECLWNDLPLKSQLALPFSEKFALFSDHRFLFCTNYHDDVISDSPLFKAAVEPNIDQYRSHNKILSVPLAELSSCFLYL